MVKKSPEKKGYEKMKGLRNWMVGDIRNALELEKPLRFRKWYRCSKGGDYKDKIASQYDAMYDYAKRHGISMDDVPDAHNCPRSFWEWIGRRTAK